MSTSKAEQARQAKAKALRAAGPVVTCWNCGGGSVKPGHRICLACGGLKIVAAMTSHDILYKVKADNGLGGTALGRDAADELVARLGSRPDVVSVEAGPVKP